MPEVRREDPPLAVTVQRHAFGWLVAANLVGVLLAVELLWPAAGDWISPFSYGRWMPLHLNWQLYGWCALPLVGVIIRYCLGSRPADETSAQVRAGLMLWTLALGMGGVWWLGGATSGKLFLDWHGAPRLAFPFALLALWAALVSGWVRRFRRLPAESRRWVGPVLLLALLATVPPVLYWSSGRSVYPPVNPHSGGATGTSLLGSTLGIIGIFGLLPHLLSLPPSAGAPGTRRFWGAFGVSVLICAALNHGHVSHHAIGQVLGLGVLLAWIPLLISHLREFAWTEGSRVWLRTAGLWWALLVVQGFLAFLPGFSERLKFTNALVSHAHLAMAGLVTAMNLVMLQELTPGRRLSSRRDFLAWQAGCVIQVVVLLILGWREGGNPGGLFLSGPFEQAGYALRLGGGLLMAGAALSWLKTAWQTDSPSP